MHAALRFKYCDKAGYKNIFFVIVRRLYKDHDQYQSNIYWDLKVTQ